jgi:hypothetical protein
VRVSVSVGGHESRWRFPETTKLEQWLDGDGWTSLGGVKTIRIPNHHYFERFSEAIKQSIIGGLSERHDARIDGFAFAGTSTSELTISQVILERMNLNMMQSEYTSLCHAARVFETNPYAYLIHITDGDASFCIENAIEFTERISKVGGQRSPLILFFCSGDVGSLQSSCELLRGFPEDPSLCGLEIDDQQLWRLYIHIRVAWETGGELERCERWERSYSFSRIPFNQDAMLENHLNRASMSDFQDIPNEIQQELTKYLESLVQEVKIDRSNIALLQRNCLLLDQRGSHSSMVNPWAARALIQSRSYSRAKSFLGRSLVCTPIANELLGYCLSIEAQERAVCTKCNLDSSLASEEARSAFIKYINKNAFSEAAFYPSECPIAPDNVWQFASFGEIIHQTAQAFGRTRNDDRHALRRLRNAIAHGHYVSWAMVICLRNLLTKLG